MASTNSYGHFYLFLYAAHRLTSRLNGERKILSLASLALGNTFTVLRAWIAGLGEIPGLVYLFAGLLVINKKEPCWILLAGFLFGLAATTKVIYLSILASVATAECVQAWQERCIPWRRWGFLIAGAIPPLVLWAWTLLPHPLTPEYLQETYEYYRSPYKEGASTVIVNLKKFFTETTPMHFTGLFAIVLSWLYLTRRENHAICI